MKKSFVQRNNETNLSLVVFYYYIDLYRVKSCHTLLVETQMNVDEHKKRERKKKGSEKKKGEKKESKRNQKRNSNDSNRVYRRV